MHQRSIRRSVLFGIVCSLMVGFSQQPVAAQRDVAAYAPHTPVSSDGSIPPMTDLGVQRSSTGELFVAPTAGTGKLVEPDPAETDTPPVPPAQSPNDDTPELSSIIGADGRWRQHYTTESPYRTLVHLESSIGGCTGFMISRDAVATAGHCVSDNGRWFTWGQAYPGRNGSSKPFGGCSWKRATTPHAWFSGENSDYDYAVIKLHCTIGDRTGTMGFRWQSGSLDGMTTDIFGYPGDKSYGTLWGHTDRVRASNDTRLSYQNDTSAGQSGAPITVFGPADCRNCAIGIHTDGSWPNNWGVRINQSVFHNLNSWRN